MMTQASYLPIALRLDQTHALLVGGGQIAANKLRLLRGRCAAIHVWSDRLHPEIQECVSLGDAYFHHGRVDENKIRAFMPKIGIVFAATDDKSINRLVSRIAQEHKVPVCVVDAPDCSTFITPALIDRSPVQVAVSTGGASPVLARRLRLQIEALLPNGMGRAAHFMQGKRSWLKELLPNVDDRRQVWEKFIDGCGYEAALSGDIKVAEETLEALVQTNEKHGEVWLVGAGPGNPDLLTLAALRLMQNADSVLYDNLVSHEILDRVRRDAERVYVGKKKSHHILPQPDIHKELLRRARKGERVLRLKGGDPFIFGRGGEEMDALLAEGISVRVVPGITAASGCGAAAGIPLTHRECSQSCIFVTGHARADGSLNLHWPTLARTGQTVVIYMGLTFIRQLCDSLYRHGLPSTWPVAVVYRGSCSDQKVVIGTLDDIAERVRVEGLRSPVTIIVGEVVKHRGINRFFEHTSGISEGVEL